MEHERYADEYNKFVTYVNFVHETKFTLLSNVHRFPDNTPVMVALSLFACIQDSSYNLNYGGAFTYKNLVPVSGISDSEMKGPSYAELRDDLFEVLLFLHGPKQEKETMYTLAHDAWMLAQMKTYDDNGTLVDNNGNSTSAQNLQPEHFAPEVDKSTLLRYTDKDRGIDMVFQAKRLTQFKDFRSLSTQEQIKDAVPVETFDLIFGNPHSIVHQLQVLRKSFKSKILSEIELKKQFQTILQDVFQLPNSRAAQQFLDSFKAQFEYHEKECDQRLLNKILGNTDAVVQEITRARTEFFKLLIPATGVKGGGKRRPPPAKKKSARKSARKKSARKKPVQKKRRSAAKNKGWFAW